MQTRFSHITTELQKELPRWFEMRKNPHAVGAQFLNVFGLQFEDVEYYLQYALDNQFISTADLQQIDIIYKASLPSSLMPGNDILLIGGNQRLQPMNSLKDFFEGIDVRFLERKEVYYGNPYYVDWEHKIIYFKRAYEMSDTFPEGVVHLQLFSEDKELIFEHDLPQTVHHVWNFFDEFGLLLDTPRLYAERNHQYKERLLDVFRNPANSTKDGLIHLLARELGLWQKKVWLDGGADFIINHTNVLLESLRVDGNKWDIDLTKTDSSGRIVLRGNPDFDGIAREVLFTSGMQFHTLHNRRDLAFQQDLYSVDRLPTPMLQYYVDIITNQVPIMWDRFVWNESFWDIANKEMSGHGFIPNFTDARFLNWQKYNK